MIDEPALVALNHATVGEDLSALLAGCEHGVCELDTDCGQVPIPYSRAGSGPPLLLLHGHPQSRAIWHRTLPTLARRFSVVATDLRGYGDAGKPATPDHAPPHSAYSKRAMAADQVALMRALGHDRFAVIGHDRGARVAHRMALDWPDRVTALMLLDIAPTLSMLEQTDQALATAYWHWFFLVQPAPFPETMISADPTRWMRGLMGNRSAGLRPFTPAAWREYERHLRDPRTVHAICEDYRAAAGPDAELDWADRTRAHRIVCPVRVHWGADGVIGRLYNPLAEWRNCAADGVTVDGGPFDCGHYIPEQAPEDILASAAAGWPGANPLAG